MAENNEREVAQIEETDSGLISVYSDAAYSEYSRLVQFTELSQQLKNKQEALDIMAADSTPSAIASSYIADVLEPNSQGDLVTLVAKDPNSQQIIDDILRRLNLPFDKIVYSLFKNGIVIGEFAHEGDLIIKNKRSSFSANESLEKSATEEVLVKVNESKIYPKIKILTDTTRIFPVLEYGEVVGFIEVTVENLKDFDFSNESLTYKDVVLHDASDYVYVKFGFRPESNPVTLKVTKEDGSMVEFELDLGKSLLESAYPAWQTLSILKDSVNLARLSNSGSSVVVTTEVGNMSEANIELSKNKLKDLFENRLAIGRNGAKSYLQPQIKPNYVYAFTKGGVGGITLSTVGGDYNPGVLYDLKYFEDEFFGAMGAVKQHFARTDDGGGLDGGGAVEQYEKRYLSNVSQFKRLLAKFIKLAINRVLLSRNLLGIYDNFDSIINKSYQEEDMQVVNLQQTKLSFLTEAINFLEITDPVKVKRLKLQALKTVITDNDLLQAFSEAIQEESLTPKTSESNDNLEDDGFDEGDFGGGDGFVSSGGDLFSEIDNIGSDADLEGDLDIGGDVDEMDSEVDSGGDEVPGELPDVVDLVDEDHIE